MAAYAALVSLLNDLELIPNHPTHSFSFDNKQLTSLSHTVNFLIDFMETYDSHGCSRESAGVLESQIAFAAHAAHDLIESHVVDQLLAGSTLGGKLTSNFSPDLQKAIDDIEIVKRGAKQFKTESGSKAEQPTYSAPSSSSQPLDNLMVGFDEVVVQLMERLTAECSSERVIPIVGMGGMGKTTLARNVYNHFLLIQQRFDIHLWATVSHEFSVENILTILIGPEKYTIDGNASGLGEMLHKKLWGRRYLIVLDDMWGVEAWDEIQMFLPDNGNGSRVIVTTRLANLGAYLSSCSFVMNFLDEDKSWELFCGKAFREEDCPVQLEEIGKKIVRRCRGLPLSIVVIGGHLRRSSRAIRYWEKVANYINPILSIGTEDEHCLDIINLSYEHLPPHLKPCFLYVGIFQEDQRIDASELIRFWVDEGFVKAKEGVSLEEVAENNLNDLIDRNLILVGERRWNGKVEYCVIHDIVRELCLKLGKEEGFMCVVDDTTQGMDIGIQKERRIVIPEGKQFNANMTGALLRSLIHPPTIRFDIDGSSDNSRLLRVSAYIIHLFLAVGRCFPYAHFQQVNLRYLAFHGVSFTGSPYLVPSSINLFWNLQTLTILLKTPTIVAPYEIWEMTQLRHLQVDGVCLPHPISGERSNQQHCVVLQNLHTVAGVENLRFTEEVCRRMPNIKEFSLVYNRFPGCLKASAYYCLHNLRCFKKLVSLKCTFGDDSKWHGVARSLNFPSSLEELSILKCHLHWEDLTVMIKSLHHLGCLELHSVQGSEWELVDEEFHCLKVLKIFECDDLIYWNANNSHFPALEIVHIRETSKLSEIPFYIGEIPTLRLILLEWCGASAVVSAMRILVEQESVGNHDIRLDVYCEEMEEIKSFRKMAHEEGLTSNKLRLGLVNFTSFTYIKPF